MDERFFVCPYCGPRISMLLDLSVSSQMYVEDCEVCCRPIEVRYTVAESRVEGFDSQRADS
jgi:transcription elongation factor Elf1